MTNTILPASAPQTCAMIRFALGIDDSFGYTPTASEWKDLFVEAHHQAMVGVLFEGVTRLRQQQKPPMALAMQWATEAERIQALNTRFNSESARLTRLFEDTGHRTAILKGQGNAQLYPNPLSRQTGDIDIYVEGGKDAVLSMLDRLGFLKDADEPAYHHVHLHPNEQGIEVEVHFLPSSGHPVERYNPRIQDYLLSTLDLDSPLNDAGFRVPSIRFQLMMQLAHICFHLCLAGVGLRHLTDYYLLLQASTEEDRRDVAAHLSKCGLKRTARAVMWVLHEVYRLDPALYIAEPSERLGRRVLAHMFKKGNFNQIKEQDDLTGVPLRDLMHSIRQQWEAVAFEPEMTLILLRNHAALMMYWIKTIPMRLRRGKLFLTVTNKDNKQ